MEPFRHHIFVCSQQKPEGVTSCAAAGSARIFDTLNMELHKQGLDNDVQVTTCGCLGLCDHGPMMIVYPEGIWYRGVKTEDVAEIAASHFHAGKPVARLAWDDAPAMKAATLEHRDHVRTVMQARDRAGILPDPLADMIRGYMPSRAILTALELDLFTAVGNGGSGEAVAAKANTNPRATEMLLNSLVSLKLLEKKDGVFRNTALSARYFVEESKDNARGGLLHTAHIWHRWSTLTDCVRAGTSVSQRGSDSSWTEAFIAAMDRNAKERARHVVKAVGTNGVRRILDLGGGSAAYSIAFVSELAGAHADILDLPDVVPLTRGYIGKAGLSDRISARAGSMLTDSFGDNYDLVLLNAICHMFSEEQNRGIFQRAFAALAPGGRLVVQDFILEADKTAPQFAALFSLNMLVGTQAGSSYSEPEYEQWMKAAGFAKVERVRLPGPSGLMVGTR